MKPWTFEPCNFTNWNLSDTRVMMVASEPNGDNPNGGSLDMGNWFNTAKTNQYYKNKLFYNRCLLMLSGILKNKNNLEKNLDNFRFVDLKATPGTSKSNMKEIKEYVEMHKQNIMEYFIPTDDKKFGIAPTIIIVVGGNTHKVFSQLIQPDIKDSKILLVYMPHPSAQIANKALKQACCEMPKKLKSIDSVPNRWYYKSKKDFGWVKYNL